MPKSKRSKVFHLSKTEKKGRESKDKLFTEIRECVDKYPCIYVFEVMNMRNTFMKEVRNDWKSSRFFFGRNRVMAKALGTTEEEEYRPDLRLLSEKLNGNVGLMFTNDEPETVKKYFESKRELDFARGGSVATEEVVIPAGPVKRGENVMPNNMEQQLRSLGMPTMLVNGVVTLHAPYTICKPGDTLTPDQAHLLKHFGHHMAEFHVVVRFVYRDEKLIDLCETSE